jgi:two-component system response regulator HydG
VEILAIDDDPLMLHTLAMVLEDQYGDILQVTHPNEASPLFQQHDIRVVILDLNFAIGDSDSAEGLAWIKKLKETYPYLSIIVLTAHGFIEVAVKALKQGASDFLEKPFTNEKLLATVQAAFNLAKAKSEITDQKAKQQAIIHQDHQALGMIKGTSGPMQRVMETIDKVAATEASLLITGDHGTGKSDLARFIHQKSLRANEPFVSVDLNALTESLFESSLFGHVKGAFTDAVQDKAGLFEAANLGTLCLDEIGSLPLTLQAKLLAALQNRAIQRIGDHRARAIDVRLICTTHQSIEVLSNESKFRKDLLYRINTVHIHLPTLRDRKEDIIPLAKAFTASFNRKYEHSLELTKEDLKALEAYHWPGNVRELKNSIERMVVLNERQPILNASAKAPIDNLYDLERNKIEEVLQRHAGNITHAAAELGIGRNTLYRKLKKYDL